MHLLLTINLLKDTATIRPLSTCFITNETPSRAETRDSSRNSRRACTFSGKSISHAMQTDSLLKNASSKTWNELTKIYKNYAKRWNTVFWADCF